MTLKNLYELAWHKPISQISKEYNISYQDFKKICRDNKIPLPENGYWSKLRFGKPVKWTELPFGFDVNKELELRVRKKINEGRKLKPQIEEPKHMHPLVIKTKKYLNSTDSYRKSIFRTQHPEDSEILPIQTDDKLQKRALSFMNLLLSQMEERGMSIVFEYGRCHAELYNQTIEINLRQKYHRVRMVDERGWSHQEFVKSNKLEFQTGYHARKNWLDTDKRKIEERIPQILDFIEKDLTNWRDIRKQQAKNQEQKNIEFQKQEDLKRIQQIEEEKTTQLFKDAENWNKAEQIRKYITAKKETSTANGIANEETKEWLIWANTKVNKLDPLL